MGTVITILSILLSISLYVNYNLFSKNEKYEDFIEKNNSKNDIYENYIKEFDKAINLSANKLKEIDRKGTFASDDEVGFFFKNLKQIQELLNNFKINGINKK